jgi:hypothetical protein
MRYQRPDFAKMRWKRHSTPSLASDVVNGHTICSTADNFIAVSMVFGGNVARWRPAPPILTVTTKNHQRCLVNDHANSLTYRDGDLPLTHHIRDRHERLHPQIRALASGIVPRRIHQRHDRRLQYDKRNTDTQQRPANILIPVTLRHTIRHGECTSGR